MLSVRDELDTNGSFPLLPSGVEINFSLLSKDGHEVWITIKGVDKQTTERVAEGITRLNPAPDLIADGETHHREGNVTVTEPTSTEGVT